MKILVVGSGGREHALISKISKSKKVSQIFAAPGNFGISKLATLVNIGASDLDSLLDFAVENKIDLTVVGPEDAISKGICDLFESKSLKIFAPSKLASKLESSKIFSKNLMKKYDIPTAAFEVFSDYLSAERYVKQLDEAAFPIVIKADGLAAGKGVVIADDEAAAVQALFDMICLDAFSGAGQNVVIEEFLDGTEISVLCFCDGKTIKPMISAKDYKRIFDNDEGPNTGGMGSVAPNPVYTKEIADFCEKHVYSKTMAAMKSEGRKFKGILFCGLMNSSKGLKVLEYNARFGDPETQVVLPLLKTDIIDIFFACIDGTLDKIDICWSDETAACVVLASKGYPEKPEIGKSISILDDFSSRTSVFHAGTKQNNGEIETAGGRVLNIVCTFENLPDALKNLYSEVKNVHFEGMQYRSDIGQDLLSFLD